ncbi:hypothetical protein OUZ56_026552 [Daphnia magna]|uniref:Secreted protein n=1 Tax=Daphnia magna TaxID=35525 RepID=A0ABQ9ZNF5_9CRUS|nr:hypothetical protein OUZ56_026552 [Daphnia magna]
MDLSLRFSCFAVCVSRRFGHYATTHCQGSVPHQSGCLFADRKRQFELIRYLLKYCGSFRGYPRNGPSPNTAGEMADYRRSGPFSTPPWPHHVSGHALT